MFTRYHPAHLTAKRKSQMPRQNQSPAFGNNVVFACRSRREQGRRMLPLLGVPLLVVPRSYTALDEQVPALAVQDDTSFLTDQWILRNFSQAARECSARDEECLTAVREAVYRLLYGSNETEELPLPVLTSTERREEVQLPPQQRRRRMRPRPKQMPRP